MTDKVCYAILIVFSLLGISFGVYSTFVFKDVWGIGLGVIGLSVVLLISVLLGLKKS